MLAGRLGAPRCLEERSGVGGSVFGFACACALAPAHDGVPVEGVTLK